MSRAEGAACAESRKRVGNVPASVGHEETCQPRWGTTGGVRVSEGGSVVSVGGAHTCARTRERINFEIDKKQIYRWSWRGARLLPDGHGRVQA